MGSDTADARVDLAMTYDHAECMCTTDERCRYHEALDRSETLAAENAQWVQWAKQRSHGLTCAKVLSRRPGTELCDCGWDAYLDAGNRPWAANPQAAPPTKFDRRVSEIAAEIEVRSRPRGSQSAAPVPAELGKP